VGSECCHAARQPGLGRRGFVLRAFWISHHGHLDGRARIGARIAQLLREARPAHRARVPGFPAIQPLACVGGWYVECGRVGTAPSDANVVLDLHDEHPRRTSQLERDDASNKPPVVARRGRAVLSIVASGSFAHVADDAPTHCPRLHRRRGIVSACVHPSRGRSGPMGRSTSFCCRREWTRSLQARSSRARIESQRYGHACLERDKDSPSLP